MNASTISSTVYVGHLLFLRSCFRERLALALSQTRPKRGKGHAQQKQSAWIVPLSSMELSTIHSGNRRNHSPIFGNANRMKVGYLRKELKYASCSCGMLCSSEFIAMTLSPRELSPRNCGEMSAKN